MSRVKRFTHSLASGYALLGANVLYTLASVPLALHYLSKQEFGLWALCIQIGGYLLLIDLGMSSSVCRILIDHKDNPAGGVYGSVIKTGFLVLVVQGACIIVGGLLISFWLPALMKVPAPLARIFWFLVAGQCVILGGSFAGKILSHILLAHQRYDVINYSQMVQLLLSFGAQWLAFATGLGLYSLLLASLVSALCGLGLNAAGVLRLRLLPPRGHAGRANYAIFKEVFSFGKEFFLLSVGLQLLSASQVVIISRTLGLEAAAVWSIGTKLFVLAQTVVLRIVDYSGSALGEMIVRGEQAGVRRRFADALLLTASVAALVAPVAAICNGDFLHVWTRGAISWPWRNDIFMGLLLVVTCVTRCHISLTGYAKQIGAMQYIFFLEGVTFVGAAFLCATRTGISGIIIAAIAANLVWSGAYGIRRTARYFGVGQRVVALRWLGPALKYLLLMALATAVLWRATLGVRPLPRLLVNSGVLSGVGLGLFWYVGLTEGLRADVKGVWRRLRSG